LRSCGSCSTATAPARSRRTNHDGVEKWDTLREKLGANTEVFSISHEQFIEGLKAVAMNTPLHPPVSDEMSGFAWGAWLNEATNSAVLDLCNELYTALTRQTTSLCLTKETRRQLDEIWRLLDTDGNGVLTAADWALTPGGNSKWDLLRKHFDLDDSAEITPDEFVAEIKALAHLQPPDAVIFAHPITTHSEMMKALNASTNRAMQNLCKELFETVRSIQQ